MKKKLLITLGCSFTEGIGCWDLSKLPSDFSIESENYFHFRNLQISRFHELGWPNRLGKKLGYDKVINLGLGGSSTSGQAKWFFQEYLNKDLSEWDVLIVWLLPEPSRISFYKDGIIINQMTNIKSTENHAFNGYFKFLSDSRSFNEDLVREQLFYRNVIKNICEYKNYNFITFNLQSAENNHIFEKLNPNDSTFSPIHLDTTANKNHFSSVCGHWNENGYELIANNMYDWINNKFTNLINYKNNDNLEWAWHGCEIEDSI